uniref:Uncharacterized protein n=1 Tax=Setaria viridis TaxID=4556 RepID=A0A4V6D4Z6_SETVI|nr:hypothetical protein SEVIR_6G010600v2 [Setaria viridis]
MMVLLSRRMVWPSTSPPPATYGNYSVIDRSGCKYLNNLMIGVSLRASLL